MLRCERNGSSGECCDAVFRPCDRRLRAAPRLTYAAPRLIQTILPVLCHFSFLEANFIGRWLSPFERSAILNHSLKSSSGSIRSTPSTPFFRQAGYVSEYGALMAIQRKFPSFPISTDGICGQISQPRLQCWYHQEFGRQHRCRRAIAHACDWVPLPKPCHG